MPNSFKTPSLREMAQPFGPQAESLAQQFTDKMDFAGQSLRRAAGLVEEDLQTASKYLNDPRNAWIGMNPMGKAGQVGLAGLSALFGIMAGPGAKTANIARFHQAQKLHKSGASKEEIWKETGWFQGVDKKWRFEIPDHNATVSPNLPRNQFNKELAQIPLFQDKPLSLNDVLHHRQLYEAYPQLRDVPVQSTGFNVGITGSFDPKSGVMRLGGQRFPEMRNTALHETQHAIQEIEDLARGGNFDMFMPEHLKPVAESIRATTRKVREQIQKDLPEFNQYTYEFARKKAQAGQPLYDYEQKMVRMVEAHPQFEEYAAALTKNDELDTAMLHATKQYFNLAGEVEARATEARSLLSPSELTQTHPLASYDTPVSDIIIKKR